MKVRLVKNVTFKDRIFKNYRIEDVDIETAKALINGKAAVPVEKSDPYKIINKARK